MIDNKKAMWTPETDIMKPYLNLEPKYKIIYENRMKHNQKVIKVKLKDNAKFVIKHLKIESTNEFEINNLFKEYRIGKILGKVTDGIAMSKDINKKEIGEYTVIEILMEYGGIPLSTLINKRKLEEGDTMNIVCQLLSTLTLMEELGISHLNIKPLNIVWDKTKNRVKLIDFEISLMSIGKDNIVHKEIDIKKILGYTKTYSAPEIRKVQERVIAQKLDVYSFGVTFLRLLAVEYKIRNPIEYDTDLFIKRFNIQELKKKVKKEDMDDLWEAIHKTIEENPYYRPTFRELREVFLKQAKRLTEDDYLLDAIDNLNDHTIKIEWIDSVKLKNIYERLIYLYNKAENYDIAIKCAKKYLETCSKLEGESSSDVAYSYYLLANLYVTINEKEEARSCFEKALSILLGMREKNNQLLRMLYKIMGCFYACLDDYKEARKQYDKAFKIKSEEYDTKVDLYYGILEIYMGNNEGAEELRNKVLEKIQKKESVQGESTAKLYITLGLVYFFEGNYDAGKRALKEALNKVLSEHGEQSSFLITVYFFLGLLDGLIGKFDQAIEALNKGLSISLAIYGKMHRSTILLYLNTAFVYHNEGAYRRSIELYNKSLNILLHKFGSQHRLTLLPYLYLGRSYYEIGDFIRAKSHFSKGLDIALKVFKEESIECTIIYDALGTLSFSNECNADKAIYYWNRALNILLKTYDEQHPFLVPKYCNLVLGYFYKCDFQAVIRLCFIGLDILLRTYGRENKMFGVLCLYLGSSYFITGNKELGIHLTTKALKIFLNIHDEQNIVIVHTYHLLGHMYETKGDYVRALETLNKALKILFKEDYRAMAQEYQEGNMYALIRYRLLGDIYRLKKDYLNAKVAYERALEFSLNVFGELYSIAPMCLYNLGFVYAELENTREAEKCFKKALSIQMRTSSETHYFIGMIHLNLALIYKKTNRYIEALYALDKSLNILNLNSTNDKDLLSNINNTKQELYEIIERDH